MKKVELTWMEKGRAGKWDKASDVKSNKTGKIVLWVIKFAKIILIIFKFKFEKRGFGFRGAV